jgi:hypothetical protein
MVSTQHGDFRQQAARRAEERMEQSASEDSFSRHRWEATQGWVAVTENQGRTSLPD